MHIVISLLPCRDVIVMSNIALIFVLFSSLAGSSNLIAKIKKTIERSSRLNDKFHVSAYPNRKNIIFTCTKKMHDSSTKKRKRKKKMHDFYSAIVLTLVSCFLLANIYN